jgi:ATP-dependent Clp protease adapter protein ClpS
MSDITAEALRQYRVILHNDDVTYFVRAACAVSRIMNWLLYKAHQHVEDAQSNGQSVLCIIHFERAEQIQQLLEDEYLTVTLEAA